MYRYSVDYTAEFCKRGRPTVIYRYLLNTLLTGYIRGDVYPAGELSFGYFFGRKLP